MRRLAVLGHPVGHSRSPVMQNAALRELDLEEEWAYEAIEVAPEGFEGRLREMPGEGFAGANVTVPHKEAALALADLPSEVAREIGAANTLAFVDGGIHAHNTDAEGFLRSLPQPAGGRRALVLGAGGAARAVVWALVREGAEVDVWNRTAARAERLCLELGGTSVTALGPGAPPVPSQDVSAAHLDQSAYRLIVNTTAVGLQGEDPFAALPLERERLRPGQVVVDMVYRQGGSALLAAAAEAGAGTVDGIEVLVQQGALSLSIWTGREAPLETMRAAARL